MDIIAENKCYLYRDVNYIKDKKLSSVYLSEGVTTTGYSPVELLINQTNKYFQESQLESRPIVQFQDLFKGVEFTPQQKYQAILAKQKFDDKFNEATRLNKRRETEQGPYAVVQTSSGTQIEITNLTRYGHPGIWKSSILNIRLEEIPEKYRSPERPHTLLAVAQIDREMENGEPKYRKLGTVSQQSVIDYKLKAGMVTEGATLVELKPELKESQTKLLFQEAYLLAENFYASIPEDQKLSAAAATWSISASRQDELEQGDNSHLNTRKKVSNFVFAAFGDEIVYRLSELQFTELKVLGINKEGDNFAGREWNPQQKYETEIRASVYPPGHERHGSRLVFVKDNDGEYKEFAVLEQRTGELPIGTRAEASIVPGEAYTATATIALPGKASVDITIREISKFSYGGKTFNGEPVTLMIGNAPVPTDTAKIKLNGKILGELDTDSIKELKQLNYLKNNNILNLQFKTIGTTKDEGAFIIAESPHGNFLRINKINSYDFKVQIFDDNQYRNVSLEIPATKNRDAVFLNGELLGVLHYKKDKEALQKLGVLNPGQMGSVPCTLQSNFSHTFVKVDSSTVEYPKTWTKESQAFQDTTKQEVMVEKSAPFLQKVKERPTILFTNQEDKMLGLMGMAVDNHKTELVQNWFKSKGIEFNTVAQEYVPLETKKGLSVLYLATSTIQSDDLKAFKDKFGEPLDAEGANSAYNKRLNSLPNRPQALRQVAVGIANHPNQVTKLGSLATTQAVAALNSHAVSTATQTPVHPQDHPTISTPSQEDIQLPANTTIKQDILEVKAGIIVQQVNCQRKMGAGLAAAFVEDVPEAVAQKWSTVKQEYLHKQDWQLGDVQFVQVTKPGEPSLVIANVAGQYDYGTNSRQTDFEALRRGLAQVNQYALDNNLSVYIPERLGSGLAGGKTQQEKDQTWATIKAIVAETIPNATIVSKPQEEEVVISGKPVQMVFLLKMHFFPNPLPVNTTIDAMRGYGRCHTTRTYEPYKAYGFKERDIAIAVAGSQQVAFRVGQQYCITQEMITNPAYQQQWAAREKHNALELATFKGKLEVWGLHMEPLGDYVNGKIVPFPTSSFEPSSVTPTVSPSLPAATTATATVSSPINIGSRSPDPLGAALSNPTVKAKELGNINGDYPVSLGDNAAVPAGKYGQETYTQDKPAGVPFLSAEQAYQHYKQTVPQGEQRVQLMAEIIQAKLEQHPKLFEAITQRGGVEWLENCTHYVTSSRDNYWEGKGKDSPFIRALIAGCAKVLEISQTGDRVAFPQGIRRHESAINIAPTLSNNTASVSRLEEITVSTSLSSSPKISNPLAQLKPLNDAVAHHMEKDVAMAEVATQFIGKSAAPPNTPSSTRNYEQAWGERANTGVYSANDTIMVSGSGPWRGVTQQKILETFKNHYVPLLDKAIASGSSFVVGNAAGTDQLVQKYLQEHGYKLESFNSDGYTRASSPELVTSIDSNKVQDVTPTQKIVTPFPEPPTQPTAVTLTAVSTPLPTTQNPLVASSQNIPQTGVMADTVGSYEQATIDSLRNWYGAADKLGKSEEYKNRIAEVAIGFKSGQELSEKVLIAMTKDMEELRSINRLTQIAQRIGDVLGQPGESGSIQVKGKTYDISLNPSQKDLTIFQKNGNVILDIQSGQVQTNQISSEIVKNFEQINTKIDTALAQVKSEYIEM
jgi:O-acetyl-ADP-ribose deacetylase (regulator of RNase III)